MYDALNRRIETVDARGGRVRNFFDVAGNLVKTIDPVGNETNFVFDALNRQVAEIDPLGKTLRSEYDLAGRMTAAVDRLGRRKEFAYDDDDRLLTETWKDAAGSTGFQPVINLFTYTWDAAGNQLTATNVNGSYAMTYDALDRMVTQQTPFGVTLTFEFDGFGNRIAVRDSLGGAVESLYDAGNRLVSRRMSTAGNIEARVDMTYTARDELASVVRSRINPGSEQEAGATNYFYDANGRTVRIQHLGRFGTPIADYVYTYDLAGRVTSETVNSVVKNFTYDATNQLTSDGTKDYQHDLAGNRTMPGYVTGPGNRLLSDGVWNFFYDDEGIGNFQPKMRSERGKGQRRSRSRASESP